MNFFLLGSSDVILGFQFAGIKGIEVDNRDDALDEFNKVVNGDYGEVGVLIITEKVSSYIEETVIKWQLTSQYPLIVEIPELEGHLEGKKTLLQSIREAIGLPV